MEVILSKNSVPIRIPAERWVHITEEHSEMAGHYYEVLETIRDPDKIFEGKEKELLALKEIEPAKYLVVIYKENSSSDGFIITAFLTRRIKQIERKKLQWQR